MKIKRRDFIKTGIAVGAGAAALGGLPASAVGNAAAGGLKGKAKWAFVIDLRRCTGCKACAVACKTQTNVVLGKFRSGVKYYEYGKYPQPKRKFVPWLCNHCDDPVCIKNCPAEKVKKPWGVLVAATYKLPDGTVVIDQDRCVGCGQCVDDCPYSVRHLDPGTKAGGDPDQDAADKCDLCYHRLKNGIVPACINTCPAGARAVANLRDPNDPVKKFLDKNKKYVKTLMPEKKTQPQCFYIDPEGNVNESYLKSQDKLNQMNKA